MTQPFLKPFIHQEKYYWGSGFLFWNSEMNCMPSDEGGSLFLHIQQACLIVNIFFLLKNHEQLLWTSGDVGLYPAFRYRNWKRSLQTELSLVNTSRAVKHIVFVKSKRWYVTLQFVLILINREHVDDCNASLPVRSESVRSLHVCVCVCVCDSWTCDAFCIVII